MSEEANVARWSAQTCTLDSLAHSSMAQEDSSGDSEEGHKDKGIHEVDTK